ncbi:MAG TPA: cytochrome c-type biogenesis protein [Pseudorhodoplanes sp.]|jgi:cytochrome c-type biogenesis protein CcmH|nr:cytochrome c-type biogenesis protein [Pseudorhodoplanes sp.]
MNRSIRAIATAAMLVASLAPALAVQPDEMLPDPALEARARALSRELRCMVCQNQSIDDSDAPLARDLRLLVRERLKAGDTDDQVLQFLVARYGDFVLLRPRVTAHSIWLWLIPLCVLVSGGVALAAFARRRGQGSQEAAALSARERARVEELTGRAWERPSKD